MNVLVVCAQDYPDMDEVRERLAKGTANQAHTTFVRKQDRILPPILDGMGASYEVFHHDLEDFLKGTPGAGDAYNCAALNAMDRVIVYNTAKSGVTGYFVHQRERLPLSYEHKIEVITKKSRVTRARKTVKRPGRAE